MAVLPNPLYSWESIFGFFVMVSIISWSYVSHIPFLLYSNIGLLVMCIILIYKIAYRKSQLSWNGGWNGMAFGLVLYFFVFVSVSLSIGYMVFKKLN